MQVAPLLYGWNNSPEKVSLAENEVHIWQASLLRTTREYELLRAFLDEDEHAQAQSFSSHEKCCQWVVTHGMLRFLLGMYLNMHPARLTFSYNAHGKPSLSEALQQEQIHFNLSHSGDLALYAFVRERYVGVDIEHVRASASYMSLARHKFTTREYETLQQLPSSERQQAFFTCWTRKEAYLKAHGEGIAYGLNSFEVSLRPGEPGVLLRNYRDPLESQRWLMRDIAPGKGYVGALLVEHKGRTPDFCHYKF